MLGPELPLSTGWASSSPLPLLFSHSSCHCPHLPLAPAPFPPSLRSICFHFPLPSLFPSSVAHRCVYRATSHPWFSGREEKQEMGMPLNIAASLSSLGVLSNFSLLREAEHKFTAFRSPEVMPEGHCLSVRSAFKIQDQVGHHLHMGIEWQEGPRKEFLVLPIVRSKNAHPLSRFFLQVPSRSTHTEHLPESNS